MSKKVALQTDPTADGSVVVVPSNQVTLNGLPIATQGSNLIYKGSPGDQPLEFEPGILINNKPLTFVGAKTSAGSTILTANQTTATIEIADGSSKEDQEEPKEEKRKVLLKSKYPFLELQKMSEQLAKSTFYFMMLGFFEKDIPITSFETLYDLLRNEDESLMPEIVVLKSIEEGVEASYNKVTKKIEVLESIVIKAVEGDENEKIEFRASLLQKLLEEYGHFLDDILRNKFSGVHGDTLKDEGAVFSYYFTNYHITDKSIDFAVAEIDGAETHLDIDLSEIAQDYEDVKMRADQDFQNTEKEHYKMGKGDITLKEYGHFDFANQLLTDKVLPNKYSLSWLYLGNFMRDMSQVITPTFSYLTDEEKKEVDGADPDIRGFFKYGFFDAFKFRRETWTKIIEVMGASHTIAEYRGDEVKALEDKGTAMVDKILNPSAVTETLSSGQKVGEFLKKKSIDLGLKGIQYSLDYMLFIKHFDHMSEEELGVYRPEEHIDSPIYAAVYDNKTSPKSLYYCPPQKKSDKNPTKPTIGDVYGMKRHIRNEDKGQEKDTDFVDGAIGLGEYAGGNLPTATKKMKEYYTKGVNTFKSKNKNAKQRLKGLSDIGAGMHILEDFFAHTNFCEILLIKNGLSVYPWIDVADAELINYKGENQYFKVNRATGNPSKAKTEEDKKGDLPDTFFGEVEHLSNILSENGTCTLLPSFWVEGIYFLFQPKKEGGKKKLYLASGKVKQGIQTVQERIREKQLHAKTNDPLKLQCVDSRKAEIYAYNYLTCSLVDDTTLSYRKEKNSNIQNYYADQIPLVSGYFSFADTMHSLIPLLEKLFEESKITVESTFTTNEFKYAPALQLVDMIVLYFLTDMELNQQEEGKPEKETGKEKSDLIATYRELIVMREVVIGIIESARKRAGAAGLVIFLVTRLINVGYAVVINTIKSIVVDMLKTMNHLITDWQSMQITTNIGTNPSHTQLAKDETDHPLHSLAADLTLAAVTALKPAFDDLIDPKSGKSNYDISSRFIEESLKYMKHPSQCTWADEIAQKWMAENPDRIQKWHEEEFEFRKAEELGKDIKAVMEKIDAIHQKMVKAYDDFLKQKDIWIEKIEKEWEELKENYEEFKKRVRRIKKGVEEEIEKTLKQADEYYNELKEWWLRKTSFYENPELNRGIFQRDSILLQTEINKAIAILEDRTLQQNGSLNITGQVEDYHRNLVTKQMNEVFKKSPFEEKLLQYCLNDTKDEKYREYGKYMKEFDDFRLRSIRTERDYLAHNPDYYLDKIGKTRSISFLHDDHDTGLSMDSSLYKAPKKKGWFG
jgi:uncharacterized Zn-binding protein involved in type VI secretion